jgi:hypothetical protein
MQYQGSGMIEMFPYSLILVLTCKMLRLRVSTCPSCDKLYTCPMSMALSPHGPNSNQYLRTVRLVLHGRLRHRRRAEIRFRKVGETVKAQLHVSHSCSYNHIITVAVQGHSQRQVSVITLHMLHSSSSQSALCNHVPSLYPRPRCLWPTRLTRDKLLSSPLVLIRSGHRNISRSEARPVYPS